jgi:hypothetical protein
MPSLMVEAFSRGKASCYSAEEMRSDETELWREPEGNGERVCVMISCCAGAELQVRRGGEILLRELYPDKATLYERATELRTRPTPTRDTPETPRSGPRALPGRDARR